MKKWIIALTVVAGVISAQAALYTETFDSNVKNGSSFSLGTDPSSANSFGFYDVDTKLGTYGSVLGSVTNGTLKMKEFTAGGNRTRATGVAIDPTGLTAGTWDISYGISDYSNANAVDGDQILFNVWLFSGVSGSSNNFVDVDMFENSFINGSIITANGAASAVQLITGDVINGNGTYNTTFTLASDVVAGDYLYLDWISNSTSQETVDTTIPSYALDNVIVAAAIPEPATLGLVAATGVGILFIRRRMML
ncbi:PEP-CTERM sorting domain-containing protein [Pontiella sulfatireligans]|uniref:Ice-binding protein C-terminal domain-containing protein n=1 Tax=Pontiella sulfatireligans TaxID=2750658 RepID=A0A6C2UGN7_9BACT|nr:PEP-CTERM sorting domain-containing protein [Pontiella sulfatireligans]VGO18581.1 hypothetical protein SCARR_00634 [Pontiella sulfatireligans]